MSIRLLKRCVVLEGLDQTGARVERHQFDLQSWYEEEHELVDSADYQTARGIACLRGWQYDAHGDQVARWARYVGTGIEGPEMIEIRADGSLWAWDFGASGYRPGGQSDLDALGFLLPDSPPEVGIGRRHDNRDGRELMPVLPGLDADPG